MRWIAYGLSAAVLGYAIAVVVALVLLGDFLGDF